MKCFPSFSIVLWYRIGLLRTKIRYMLKPKLTSIKLTKIVKTSIPCEAAACCTFFCAICKSS